MKIELTKEDMKPVRAPSRAGAFLAALGANWLILVAIGAAYVLLVAAAYVLKRPPAAVRPMDIVFVFDTTGSMQDEMDGTVSLAQKFVDRLSQSHISSRLALVAFGALDERRPVIRASVPFTNDVSGFRRALGDLRAEGGGKEDTLAALHHALADLPPRESAETVYILITDEVYNIPSTCNRSFQEIDDDLERRGVHVYAVTCAENADRDAELAQDTHASRVRDLRRLASDTGGRWYDIHGSRDFTDILQNIAEDIATSLVR